MDGSATVKGTICRFETRNRVLPVAACPFIIIPGFFNHINNKVQTVNT